MKRTVKKRARTIFVLLAAAFPLPAQTLTTLHSFDSVDGNYPTAALTRGCPQFS